VEVIEHRRSRAGARAGDRRILGDRHEPQAKNRRNDRIGLSAHVPIGMARSCGRGAKMAACIESSEG
jgi:hypothetical protein